MSYGDIILVLRYLDNPSKSALVFNSKNDFLYLGLLSNIDYNSSAYILE